MKTIVYLGIFLISAVGFQNLVSAQNKCYTLANDTGQQITVNFTYPGGIIPTGGLTTINMPPKTIQTMCFERGTGATAIANAQWQNVNGNLIMGDLAGASNAGTYRLVVPSPAGIILPGHEKFTLTHYDKFPFHPALGAILLFAHIEITCNNGEKWKLVCLPDGSLCNVSVDEYLHGLTQWNVGQCCDGAHGNADDTRAPIQASPAIQIISPHR